MTTMVVLAERPAETALAAFPGLSDEEARRLYCASLADVCETILHGKADLLVNYPDPEWFDGGVDPEAELQAVLDAELDEPDAVRYEVQVGETKAARVGNALTHLLDAEDETTAAVVDPYTPLLAREHIGTLAMKLRTSDVVVGPAQAGRLSVAGFTTPIDFDDIYATPAVETVTNRAREQGLAVEFLPVLPRLDTSEGLATTLSLVRARLAAERLVPPRTAAFIENMDQTVAAITESDSVYRE
jgi:glycosyltransferase A (GT-A) superfamily protein (DUF2064 family)